MQASISPQRAVYVSSTGIDNAGCGATVVAACQTIQQGINNCAGTGCGILVRHGLYRVTAPVTLVNGVSVYGSCTFDNSPILYRATVVGPSPVISADKISSPTTMHGLVVKSR